MSEPPEPRPDRRLLPLWARVATLEAEGRRFALCTVVESQGSVPRRAGAHMLVFEDGAIEGSVGGAGMEQQTRAAALEVLARGAPRLVRFELWYKKSEGLDSLCGGSVAVYIEPVEPGVHVLICGGGHIGLALARILEVNEYLHTVWDDRPEYASRERFPAAAEVCVASPESFWKGHDPARYTHVVLLGYSHGLDHEMLRLLLPRYAGWVGLVGSRAKAREFRARLMADGLTAAQVERLSCPVGLDIGAETAAEIATAIAAQLVQSVRRKAAPGGAAAP